MPELQEQVTELSAHLHAGTARLCGLVAELDVSGDWQGHGIRSCAHWLTINTGFEMWTARDLLRVGHALERLPQIAAAFAAGRLSFDKVRALIQVAVASDEHIWLAVALEASGSQMGRICRAFHRSIVSDDPDRATEQQARRRLSAWWREDGMLDVFVTLPPEDGRLVLNAVEAAMAPPRTEAEAPLPGYVNNGWSARRADALVRVCERWLDDAAASAPRGSAPRQLAVHVDLGVMTGVTPDGRCHLDDGPALSAAAARRIGCDAEVFAIVERDGALIDVGSARRIVSARMRRALQARDATCRFPGCNVRAADTEAHHVKHWAHQGKTKLCNLVSLCRYHHHRHHDGAFVIAAVVAGGFRFERPDGTPLATPPVAVDPEVGGVGWLRAASGSAVGTPRAGDAGAPCDLAYALEVIAHNSGMARAAAVRGP